MRPGFKPQCFGLYKDSSPNCKQCMRDNDDIAQKCAEELVLSILEGRNRRPAAIIELGKRR